MNEATVTVRKLQAAIDQYCANWRKPGLSEIELSDVYDLKDDWDAGNPWPNPGDAGIYAILDKEQNLLYVGKASMTSMIGTRLSSYFQYGDKRECVTTPGHIWEGKPAFVVSAAVSEPWEAPSLEEYLLHELDPNNNRTGRKDRENGSG